MHELIVTFYIRANVTTCCTSYESILTYKLRVTIYCQSYKLNLSYKIRDTIYCTIWDSNVDFAEFLNDTG